eukprot:CAMPEP_0201506512 /NCGR_PEP_ID=MMETSP0161_2-20130828/448_1 /ASSEMBLY_ACC=CAM_ASM_000251 /TAXON_ID=180227 /ORGANISM="Neoparamoeba aestuarina, Strain SoJaBio B1-5/56/2" /LENGTH=68 /DNA_ID=CAMNT_0047900627 /DNA_START=128 /DNA_END=334 /DNA_ORIENTATION=-
MVLEHSGTVLKVTGDIDKETVAPLCVRMLQNANHLIENDSFERISVKGEKGHYIITLTADRIFVVKKA